MRWIVVAVVLGSLSGAIVYGVREILVLLAGLREMSPGPLFFALPAFGGAVNGFLIYRIDREARGDGTHTYIRAAGDPEFRLGPRFVLLKILATLMTVGSGARGGLVGPLAAAHAGIGTTIAGWFPFLGRFVKDGEMNLRPSAVCGAAGAVGALLSAPLGGGPFAVEILFGGSLAYAALFPAILTSTTAYFVCSILRGTFPAFPWVHPGIVLHTDPSAVAIVLATSVAAGFVGILFVFLNKRLPFLLQKRGVPCSLRPVVGALGATLIAIIAGKEILYSGQDLFVDRIPLLLETPGAFSPIPLLTLLAGTGLAVGFVVGGSGSGGLTMPAMTLGILTGAFMSALFSIPPAESLPFFVAGMAACLASSLNVPIAAAVVSLEIFGAETAYAAVLGSVIGYQIGRGHLMYRYLQK